MGARSRALAGEFERALAELAGYASGLTAAQWRTRCGNHPTFRTEEDEHRPVGVVVHHVADWFDWLRLNVEASAAGRPPIPLALGSSGATNAAHETANPDPDQRQTVAMLKERGAVLVEAIRQVTDEGLDQPRPSQVVPTVEQFIRRVVLGHVEQHLLSIRTTLEG